MKEPSAELKSQQRNESITLSSCCPITLFACLVCGGLGCLRQIRSVSWWREVFSDLPLRKISSRQPNLPGKLLGAPHGLVKGRGYFLFIWGFISFIIHYELKSVRLISEVLKTSYKKWSAIPMVVLERQLWIDWLILHSLSVDSTPANQSECIVQQEAAVEVYIEITGIIIF